MYNTVCNCIQCVFFTQKLIENFFQFQTTDKSCRISKLYTRRSVEIQVLYYSRRSVQRSRHYIIPGDQQRSRYYIVPGDQYISRHYITLYTRRSFKIQVLYFKRRSFKTQVLQKHTAGTVLQDHKWSRYCLRDISTEHHTRRSVEIQVYYVTHFQKISIDTKYCTKPGDQ